VITVPRARAARTLGPDEYDANAVCDSAKLTNRGAAGGGGGAGVTVGVGTGGGGGVTVGVGTAMIAPSGNEAANCARGSPPALVKLPPA
jgi:hypothetical protein